MSIYAIDIDGTLTIETEGWDYAKRTPNFQRIAGVNKLIAEGHEVVLYTARFEEDREVTKIWLADNGVKYHRLILGKPQYDFYIDDKALTPDFLEKL